MFGYVKIAMYTLVIVGIWYYTITYWNLKKFKDAVTLESKYQEKLNIQGADNAKSTNKAIKNIEYDGCDSNCTARL